MQMKNQMHKQSGLFVTYPIVAMLPIIFSIITFIIELKHYYLKRQQLSTSTDMAVLAGAAQLGITSNNVIIASATNYFNVNNNNTESQISITFGHWNSNNNTFTPTTTNPNAIQATASEPFSVAKFANLTPISVNAVATKNPLSSASYLVQ